LQSRLGNRTVLVQQALARTPDGLWGTATLLLTREGAAAGGVYTNVPDGWTMLTEDGKTARMHHVGVNVAGLRRELREGWTPHEAASDEVRKSLNVRQYFGHMTDALKMLHEQGKDHLCIVPHGPLHFLPYHLLELEGRPLADDWIVTYMPSVGLLQRASGLPGGRERRSEEVAVFGVGFGSEYPFGLPELPESVAEAEAVASVYYVRPKLDRDATPKSVRHALEHARVVHLSTHGRHNVVAPGFQTLYLWPADGSDGRLRAYEIATLDLAGLDVITLSACETALGRFDFSDNLRGLPATLLLGGVSAIVGTLWNVGPAVSLAFFKEFHA
jgi:CHAT domain-containing protein